MRRRILIALALIALASEASAADYETPVLRGSSPYVPAPPRYTRWSGFYVGGQVGYSSAHVDFNEASQSIIAFALRDTALEEQGHVSQYEVLGQVDKQGVSFGGFAGYNWQFDDVVVGMDLNYSHFGAQADAPSFPITRALGAGGNSYNVTVRGNASMRINDIVTARARAGFAFDSVLPFATVGFAVARTDIDRSASISGTENPGTPQAFPFNFGASESKSNFYLYGMTGGLGIDMMILPSWFVRAEYEYIHFFDASGFKTQMQTGRIGAGYRF
jgi:opacity protein-like surface antigen